jgi:trehalose 6-phosphate phosphatase
MVSANEASDLLTALAANADSGGVFSDFDGTLSPIVDDPASARPIPGAADVLGRLAERFRMVAVVSGRPGAFLAEHLGGRGLTLRGLYGLEPVDADGTVRCVADADHWRSVVDQVATRAEAELPPEVSVERKGLSATVHFRRHPDQEDTARRWAESAATGTGLLLHPARMSFELRPPLPHDKGMVVADLASDLTHVCFLGDDVGDLEAFDALDALADAGATTVKVAVSSTESVPDLVRRADLVVDGAEGALELLRNLADRAENGETADG